MTYLNTYEHDEKEAARQLDAVKVYMRTAGGWRTLAEIRRAIDAPEASISARLRDLRKNHFGGYTVDRRIRAAGVFEYRVL